jgi:uncharacterized protein
MDIFSEITEILNTRIVYLATTSRNGTPNVVPMGGKELLDHETLVIVDVRMNKTRTNILENPRVAVIVEDLTRKKPVSLQIKGTARFYDDGEYLEKAKNLSDRAWAKKAQNSHKRKRFPVKAALVIKISEIFCNLRGGIRIYPENNLEGETV